LGFVNVFGGFGIELEGRKDDDFGTRDEVSSFFERLLDLFLF
jgi:hypothetical protein